MHSRKKWLGTLLLLIPLVGCKSVEISDFKSANRIITELQAKVTGSNDAKIAEAKLHQIQPSQPKSLSALLKPSNIDINFDTGVISAVSAAIENDPAVKQAKYEVEARLAALEIAQSRKNVQISGSVYGGVEDVSDKKSGAAAVVNINRLIKDGGSLDAVLRYHQHRVAASKYELQAKIDERGFYMITLWVELMQQDRLNDLVGSRLQILNPIISQLEKIADAGVSDVSQVDAARRTVSSIRVTQADLKEQLMQARVNFVSSFGEIPSSMKIETDFLQNNIPSAITEDHIKSTPLILARYSDYLAAIANLEAVRARREPTLNLQGRLTRPFGDSGESADETVGLVWSKNFYDGEKTNKEIRQAEIGIRSAEASILQLSQEGERSIRASQEAIAVITGSIKLAEENVAAMKEEIDNLRKQLVIGGSTLDSVLTAEARLFDAESQLIRLQTERTKSLLRIFAGLGLLSHYLDTGDIISNLTVEN